MVLFNLDKSSEEIENWLSVSGADSKDCSGPYPLDFGRVCDPELAEDIQVTLIDLGQGQLSAFTIPTLCIITGYSTIRGQPNDRRI